MRSEPYSLHREVPWVNRATGAAVFILQHKLKKSGFLETVRQANVRSINRRLAKRLKKQGLKAGRTIEIERRRNLTDKEFVKEYLNKGLPVIFDGEANDWPCTRNWNFDYLQSRMGDRKLAFYESAGLMEPEHDVTGGSDKPVITDELTADEFAGKLKKGEKKYLRFSTLFETERSFKADLDQTWLKKMRRCLFGVGYHAFIGAGGRYTPTHQDNMSVFYIMAEGEKRWTLFSAASSSMIQAGPSGRVYNFTDVDIKNPDLNKYPGFDLLSRYTCTLKKGDILYLPTWTWHHVENLTESWGVSYRFTSLRDFIRYPTPVFVRLFLMKPSFFKTFFSMVISRASSKQNATLLTPQIFGD